MWGTRFLLLISSLTFFGSTATGPPDGDFLVHTIAVGQGDAHVIECNTPAKRDFAIVDMGTSSIKDARTVDRIKKIVGNSVSNIFLTHPDEDHYNYLKNFQNKKNVHFHLGGDLDLWGEGTNSKKTAADIIAPLIYDQSNKKNEKENRGYSVYTETDFFETVKNSKKRVRKSSIDVDLCNKKMKMEILLGGYTTSNVNDKNGASLVMRLSGPGLKSMLFMGDFFESNGIDYLLSDEFKIKNNLKADVWLLPHHGAEIYNLNANSKESQTKYKNLANAVGAKKIVISSNIKGSYAHPRCVTVKNLFYNPYNNGQQCAAKPPNANDLTKDYVQCWSEVPGQERLYRPEFCQWRKDVTINDVKIYQTTREDRAGNVIWKDVETDLKTGNVVWKDIQN